MRVLHVIPDVNGGGASKGAYRIHQAVTAQGIQSELLVLRNPSNEPNTRAALASLGGWLKRKRYKSKDRHMKKQMDDLLTDNPALHSYGLTSVELLPLINQSDADIIHLHWIIHMLTIEEIAQITKPIMWTFADMWPICGGEHYVLDDSPSARFRVGYLPNNQPTYERGPDYNRFAWERKRQHWGNKIFHIAACSHWLAQCAKASPIFTQSHIEAINYPLNTGLFRPYPRQSSRDKFQLPQDKKIILAGATGGVNSLYKGGDLLRDAINALAHDKKNDIIVALFGASNDSSSNWTLPVYPIGPIEDETTLAQLYSSADIFVMPSRQEAFGQVASEAQSCGVPVAAFNHGGAMDIVDHQKTGWLATPFDPSNLAYGIDYLIDQKMKGVDFAGPAREQAIKLFSLEQIGKKYCALYEKSLSRYA